MNDRPRRDHVLRVDLTERTVSRERVPESWLEDYIGGKGLGARYLYEDVPAGVDPLGPENLLGFMLGPLSGALPGESRYAAVTKSPLTGAFLDSYSGGRFPDRLAGALPRCLGVLVVGRSDEPVRVEIADGEGRVVPSSNWGSDTVTTAEAFPDAAVACIGPAAESGVQYATIASDAGDHHAGRGGAGAVMGAKRLKSIVVRGDSPPVSEELAELKRRYETVYEEHDTGEWQAAGETIESIDFANELGVLATEGWTESNFEGASGIGIEAATEAAVERENPEDAVPGGFRVETDDGDSVPRGAAPMTLGAGLGIDEFDAVATLGELCDRLGMDVIDAGNAVAWAIRANEEGLVDCDLEFGDEAGACRLLEAIATGTAIDGCRSSVPETLAGGVSAAAERFGGAELIPTVKSMAVPSYDPRGAAGMALAYATSDRGGCHRRSRPIEREAFAEDGWNTRRRVEAVVDGQNSRSVLWSLVVDDFAGETMWADLGSEWLAAVGRETTPEELAVAGERIWTLIRLFNVREGFDRDDDTLPEVFEQPISDGPAEGSAVDDATFETLLDAYYARRGWSDRGLPTRKTLSALGLDSVIDDDTPIGDDRIADEGSDGRATETDD
ncbi:MAG: aldehyde ferredoxin oxidoreductase C-terminal domain-containing protein [Natronomonas sp.]